MELDTGAAVSLISDRTHMFPCIKLTRRNLHLKSYTGEPIAVLGELLVQVKYKQQHKHLALVVAAGFGPTLMGRNWLQ